MIPMIISAAQITFDELVAAFNLSYEGYIVPVSLNADQLRAHVQNYDVDLNASRVVMLENMPAGMALLGRRDGRGWVGGIGIAPAYRNQGLGRQLMAALIDEARSLAVTTVQLEVIVGNDNAYHLYERMGFETTRRLLILERAPAPTEDAVLQVESVSAADALAHYDRLHTAPNPWQRERETLLRMPLSGWAVIEAGQVTAYAVGTAQPERIQWFDMAAENDVALGGVIAHVHNLYPNAVARLVNLAEDDPAWRVLESLGYHESMSQWEMQLAL